MIGFPAPPEIKSLHCGTSGLVLAGIATLLLTESSKRLATEKGIEYVAGDDVVAHLLASGGFDPQLGARPMRQTVQRLVEGPLAERILQGEFGQGDRVHVALAAGELAFSRLASAGLKRSA